MGTENKDMNLIVITSSCYVMNISSNNKEIVTYIYQIISI